MGVLMSRFAVLLGLLLVSSNIAAAGLSGLWVGYYSYGGNARVPMSVVIQSDGPMLIGQMIEPQTSGETLDIGRPAIIFGELDGNRVVFDKAYFSDLKSITPIRLKEGAQPVEYKMVVSQQGQAMSGQWFIGEAFGEASFKRVTPETVDRLR
jgi:hypothetical protein